MAIKVKVTRTPDGFVVKWPQGLVAVRSQKQADALKANVLAGMSPSSAIFAAIVPPRRKLPRDPGKYAKLGGQALAAKMTPEERSASARRAAAARWGTTATVPVAVEEVQ